MRNTTYELLDILKLRIDGPGLLDVGSPVGEVSVWAADHGYSSSYYHTDLIACRTIADQRVTVLHSADLPQTQFDMVAMDSTVLDTPFACDVALSLSGVLSANGEFLSVPPRQWSVEKWIEHLNQAYDHILVVSESENVTVVSCKNPSVQWSPNRTVIRAEIGESRYRFHSAPGIFSPQAIDRGTLSMLEEMAALGPQQRVLDLGCGIGVVGIHLANLWGSDVIAIDTNARALHLTARNAEENGVSKQIRVLASDGFSDVDEVELDVIATNPPYHTNYSVAKRFIHGAHRHLRVGGRLWVVIKRPDWYINRIRSVFGGCTVIQKNRYFVLSAAKRSADIIQSSKATKPQTTSRKHLKRMEEAEQRKKVKHRIVK